MIMCHINTWIPPAPSDNSTLPGPVFFLSCDEEGFRLAGMTPAAPRKFSVLCLSLKQDPAPPAPKKVREALIQQCLSFLGPCFGLVQTHRSVVPKKYSTI